MPEHQRQSECIPKRLSLKSYPYSDKRFTSQSKDIYNPIIPSSDRDPYL
jgi:hypothetical protein